MLRLLRTPLPFSSYHLNKHTQTSPSWFTTPLHISTSHHNYSSRLQSGVFLHITSYGIFINAFKEYDIFHPPRRSPMPVPWMPDMGYGWPNPKDQNSCELIRIRRRGVWGARVRRRSRVRGRSAVGWGKMEGDDGDPRCYSVCHSK